MRTYSGYRWRAFEFDETFTPQICGISQWTLLLLAFFTKQIQWTIFALWIMMVMRLP
jgi:hypothetical protein